MTSIAATRAPSSTATRPAYTYDIALLSGMLFCCTFLQRFGVPFGGKQLNIVGPIGIAIAVWGLLTDTLVLDRRRLMIFLAMLCCVMPGQAHVMARMPAYSGSYSLPSLGQWLGITGFAVFAFRKPMPEDMFFRIVNGFFGAIALCGIAQFFVQFAGLQLFRFTDVLPHWMLAEDNWNLQIYFGVGALFKSNGFFLVEPSVTSQFMALALGIEFLYFRRPLYFALLGLNLVLAFSGTGEIVLACLLLAMMVRLGRRGLALGLLAGVFLAAVGIVAVTLVPEIAAMVASRSGEISEPGSSGFARFVTPFWLLSDVMHDHPSALLLGIGAGVSEGILRPYVFDVNTPIKVVIEYGLPTLICYVLLFLVSRRTARQSVLVLPGLVLMMITGAYQQFGPVVFLITLLICTANLAPSPILKTAVQRPPAAGHA